MVKRKTFVHNFSDEELNIEQYSKTGLYGSNVTECNNICYHCPRYSSAFLNDMYSLLIDSGYSDAVKNDEDYMITVLGLKIICLVETTNTFNVTNYCQPIIFLLGYTDKLVKIGITTDYAGSSGLSEENIINKNDKTDMNYNLLLKGDNNGFAIYYGSYSYPNAKYQFLHIRKCKNLMDDKEMFFISKSLDSGSGTPYILYNSNSYKGIFIDLDLEYSTPLTISSGTNLNSFFGYFSDGVGYNTNHRYVTYPVICYYGTILMYGMIMSNSSIFSSGNYYKIGTDVYYCENNLLFKVE